MRLVVVLSLVLLPAPCPAWNDLGHKVVAQIALDGLTPKARKSIQDILEKHPRYEQDLLKGLPKDAEPFPFAWQMAATWPDIIRSNFNPLHKTWHKGTWHYINFPINLEPDTIQGLVPKEEGGDVDNILKALKYCIAQCKNANVPPADKAIYLCWIAHLVGDLHQPLHTTALFSKQFPDGDRGGNLFIVRSTSGRINLHAYWDSLLGNAEAQTIIGFHAQKIQTAAATKREAFAKQLEDRDFKSWALEGFRHAQETVYLQGKLKGANQVALDADNTTPVPALPAGYEQQARDLGRARVGLAGYRLADVLNDLFKD